MINQGDLGDFGILSAKDADYISHNQIDDMDKTIMHVEILVNNFIARAALKNKTETCITLDNLSFNTADTLVTVKKLLEDLGYDVVLEIISCSLLSKKTIFMFKISW